MNPDTLHSPVRTVIVDDEPTARRGIRLLLAPDPEVEIVGEAGAGDEALELIERARPDLAFLDVQIPAGDGLSLLGRLSSEALPAVVFVTAYDEYALRAFEVNAVDYLLKPFDDARFHAALDRAKSEVRSRRAGSISSRLSQLLEYFRKGDLPAASAALARSADRILVKSSGEILFLKPEEIDWIEAEGDYVKFHVAGRTHLMRETMVRLASRLDSQRFIRIHRSTIVNIERVRKLSPSFGGNYAVILLDGTKLTLSRGFHEGLSEMLKQAR